MKTAYLIGTNNLEKYDYEEIKKYNIKVVAVGTAKSFSLKEKFLSSKNIEFLQVDTIPFEDKNIEIFDDNDVINKISDHLKHDNYIYTCDEKYILTAAKVRDALGIIGASYKESLLYRDKFLMKSDLLEKGLDLPKFFDMSQNIPTYNELSRFLESENIILKPKDLAGSHGVVKITNETEYNTFLSSYNKNFKYMAETFIDGDLYHFDAIIHDKKIDFFICEYAVPPKLHTEGFLQASMVLNKMNENYVKLKEYGLDILRKTKVRNTFVHMEIFMQKNKNPIFLELAIRPPGAHIPELYKYNYNLNVYQQHLYANLGIDKPLVYDDSGISYITGNLPYIPKEKNIYLPVFESEFKLNNHNSKDRLYTGNIGSILGRFTLKGKYFILKEDFLKLKNYKIYR